MKLTAKRFQVLNYRNIDDSDWIPLERITAFVGRNEAGKTALLKALHKFNPATEEPYNPQREFPRDRFTADFRDGGEWPVCRVEFELSADFREELGERLDGAGIPRKAVLTRYYDGSLEYGYDTEVSDDPLSPDKLVGALEEFARSARRLPAPAPDQEPAIQALRTQLADWADGHKEAAGELQDLRSEKGVELLEQVRGDSNVYAQPASADLIEALQHAVDELRDVAEELPLPQQLDEAVEAELPVFIYFENYGILDSAVYLPRFLEDLASGPEEARVRTINAVFKHVNLSAQEISDLGREEAGEARAAGRPVTAEVIAGDQQRKELRNVKLNSASIDISRKFSAWFGQRRHKIRYQADGPYFSPDPALAHSRTAGGAIMTRGCGDLARAVAFSGPNRASAGDRRGSGGTPGGSRRHGDGAPPRGAFARPGPGSVRRARAAGGRPRWCGAPAGGGRGPARRARTRARFGGRGR